MGRYKAAGLSGGIPDHKGSINVQPDNTTEGTTIVIPDLKIEVAFRHPTGVVTATHIKNLARLTGKVNSTPFLGFAPGEVLFMGASGSEGTDTETEVTYSFVCSENATDLVVGGITITEKQGHDLVWTEHRSVVQDGFPTNQPRYAYVERVYRRADLAAALGFGGGA